MKLPIQLIFKKEINKKHKSLSVKLSRIPCVGEYIHFPSNHKWSGYYKVGIVIHTPPNKKYSATIFLTMADELKPPLSFMIGYYDNSFFKNY
jgi:hypothetical protein